MVNLNKPIVAFIVGILVASLVFFLFNSFKKEPVPIPTPSPTPKGDTSKYYEQAKLDKCLEEAQAKFDDIFRLNSHPGTGKDAGKSAWNSAEIAESTTEQFNKDRDFCLKAYK